MALEGDYVIERPNRAKASSQTTKAVVVLLLVVSAVLMLIVGIGGWSKLIGAQPVLIAYIVVYLVMAYYVGRWNRGVLPVAGALAILLAIFAAVAGPSWFARDKAGFASPESVFGGGGLEPGLLGLITLVLVPIQVLLIGFAMEGFRQAWNVEVEVPVDEARGGGGGGALPASA